MSTRLRRCNLSGAPGPGATFFHFRDGSPTVVPKRDCIARWLFGVVRCAASKQAHSLVGFAIYFVRWWSVVEGGWSLGNGKREGLVWVGPAKQSPRPAKLSESSLTTSLHRHETSGRHAQRVKSWEW